MGWGSVPWLPALQPVQAERIVYAVHQYGPFQYTHQQPNDDRPYPGEFDINWNEIPDRFDRNWLLAYLNPISALQQQTGAPVAVNEFGVVRWAPAAFLLPGKRAGCLHWTEKQIIAREAGEFAWVVVCPSKK